MHKLCLVFQQKPLGPQDLRSLQGIVNPIPSSSFFRTSHAKCCFSLVNEMYVRNSSSLFTLMLTPNFAFCRQNLTCPTVHSWWYAPDEDNQAWCQKYPWQREYQRHLRGPIGHGNDITIIISSSPCIVCILVVWCGDAHILPVHTISQPYFQLSFLLLCLVC